MPGVRPALRTEQLHPRVPLAALPTPLVDVPRLAAGVGVRSLHVKRDDLVGFAMAGNKARKLEFLLGDAVARGCNVLVTGGGPGSNFCAAAAAAARVAGLACELVLYGEEPGPGNAPLNLELARAWGAHIRFTGDRDRSSVDRAIAAVSAAIEADGGRAYAVPRGGATAVGALGYVEAARELAVQIAAHGLRNPVLVLATGSGGTQAGLLAGAAATGLSLRVVGASVSRPAGEIRARIAEIAGGCAVLLGAPAPGPASVEVVDARGPGYGLPSKPGIRAARIAADTEGLLLDHVFTAKALGVLTSLGGDGDLVFLHTGGVASSLAALAEGGSRGGA